MSLQYVLLLWTQYKITGYNTITHYGSNLIIETLDYVDDLEYFVPNAGYDDMWAMEARIDYKKLMLLHSILNSPDERILKNVILDQKRSSRLGTQHHEITKLLKKYGIQLKSSQLGEVPMGGRNYLCA